MLPAAGDIELTGAATDGLQAVELALHSQPDVVVMDLHMPGMDGIEATRRIVADSPHIAVLVLTMFDDDESVFAAIRAGARGYLLKGADQEQIRRRRLAPRPTGRSSSAPSSPPVSWPISPPAPAAPAIFPQLTDREREVLELVAQGRSNADDRAAGCT